MTFGFLLLILFISTVVIIQLFIELDSASKTKTVDTTEPKGSARVTNSNRTDIPQGQTAFQERQKSNKLRQDAGRERTRQQLKNIADYNLNPKEPNFRKEKKEIKQRINSKQKLKEFGLKYLYADRSSDPELKEFVQSIYYAKGIKKLNRLRKGNIDFNAIYLTSVLTDENFRTSKNYINSEKEIAKKYLKDFEKIVNEHESTLYNQKRKYSWIDAYGKIHNDGWHKTEIPYFDNEILIPSLQKQFSNVIYPKFLRRLPKESENLENYINKSSRQCLKFKNAYEWAEFCFFKYQLNREEENLFEGIEVTNINGLVKRFRFKYINNLIEYP